MGARAELYQIDAAERCRRAERARDEANRAAVQAKNRPDSIHWKDGTIWRWGFGEYFQCGDVLKDGRITWYGEVAGRIVDGLPVYGKGQNDEY